jgi:hypothetical protein
MPKSWSFTVRVTSDGKLWSMHVTAVASMASGGGANLMSPPQGPKNVVTNYAIVEGLCTAPVCGNVYTMATMSATFLS